MNSPTEMSYPDPVLSYAAGILDGEGTVTLMQQGYKYGHPVYIPQVLVTSTCLPLIEFFLNTFGGNIKRASKAQVRQGGGRWKRAMQWSLAGALAVEEFLPRLLPYLIIKKPQTELLLEYIANSRRSSRLTWALSPKDIEQRLEIKKKMLLLNAKGRSTEYVSLPSNILPVELYAQEQQQILYAYLAGLLDGEGSFSIPSRRAGLGNRKSRIRSHYLCPFILISSTTLPILEWLKKVFGGKTYLYSKDKRVPFGQRQCGYWYENKAENILLLLERSAHYLIIKQEHASVLIEFVEGTKHNWRYLPPGELERRQKLKDRLTVLNRKGTVNA